MIAVPLNLELALLSAGILGFRHGFDYDHVAAISDIASIQASRSKAMRLGLLYALGHASMIVLLGSAVIFLQLSLPRRIDLIAERLVGLTLIVLGGYVLYTMFDPDHGHLPPTRFAILRAAFEWAAWRVRKLFGISAEPRQSPSTNYDNKTVFVIGVVHGLGAETPSQLLIFLLAANLGGLSRGFLGLFMFILGLLSMNTLMTGLAAGILSVGRNRLFLRRAVAGITATYSIIVGFLFLTGFAASLPPLG